VNFFALLGILLGIYTAYAAFRGSVFVRHRAWGRTVHRDETPAYFWSCIAIYGGLSIALLTVF
jgi:hypothetical protein